MVEPLSRSPTVPSCGSSGRSRAARRSRHSPGTDVRPAARIRARSAAGAIRGGVHRQTRPPPLGREHSAGDRDADDAPAAVRVAADYAHPGHDTSRYLKLPPRPGAAWLLRVCGRKPAGGWGRAGQCFQAGPRDGPPRRWRPRTGRSRPRPHGRDGVHELETRRRPANASSALERRRVASLQRARQRLDTARPPPPRPPDPPGRPRSAPAREARAAASPARPAASSAAISR